MAKRRFELGRGRKIGPERSAESSSCVGCSSFLIIYRTSMFLIGVRIACSPGNTRIRSCQFVSLTVAIFLFVKRASRLRSTPAPCEGLSVSSPWRSIPTYGGMDPSGLELYYTLPMLEELIALNQIEEEAYFMFPRYSSLGRLSRCRETS